VDLSSTLVVPGVMAAPVLPLTLGTERDSALKTSDARTVARQAASFQVVKKLPDCG
jgi:hypothetical protein